MWPQTLALDSPVPLDRKYWLCNQVWDKSISHAITDGGYM